MSCEIEDAPLNAGDDESQVIADAIRSLPPHVVKDLLSIGVCLSCILRLFGIRGHAYSCASVSPAILLSVLEQSNGSGEHLVDIGSKVNGNLNDPRYFQDSETEPLFCSICLGILQFAYSEEKESSLRKDCAKDFAVSISNLVKKEGHQIDSFSIEVSVPQIIMANENAIWSYIKMKYGNEHWFLERFSVVQTSLKDALKLAITSSLESLLDVRSAVSSFHIRLTYTHSNASLKLQNFLEKDQGCKRRKTGTEDSLDSIDGSQPFVTDGLGRSNCESDAMILKSLNSLQEPLTLLKKVNQPCHLAMICYRTPIYIGGRYLKYSRNVSQTRWIIDDERMGEASVEEIIGSNILPICQADNYKFHAAGREDIDVRMLGSGRPFLVEVQNARCVPSKVSTKEIESRINNLEDKLIGVKNLKLVDSQGWNLMHEGEAEKQKQYTALVWIPRQLDDKDLEILSSLKDMHILQRTPIRVLHRRSPLEREKTIHWMRIERIKERSQYFLLHLCTQAGTYIKEFIHGDLGRTHPCIGSILGCRAEILRLDVTDVKMDCFLSE